MIALTLAVMVGLSPALLGTPDPPRPYGWVCGYLDKAPTLFGVMGLLGEVTDRGLEPHEAEENIATEIRKNCSRHVALISDLRVVFK
jgi:hypothetical protein